MPELTEFMAGALGRADKEDLWTRLKGGITAGHGDWRPDEETCVCMVKYP